MKIRWCPILRVFRKTYNKKNTFHNLRTRLIPKIENNGGYIGT